VLTVAGTKPTAWLLQIDHWDLDRSNNRWGNLREATNAQNAANRRISAANTSGFKGVGWHKTTRKWTAQCKVGGKRYYLGEFRCLATASIIHDVAVVLAYEEYARIDPSIREALNAPCEPQPRFYLRPPHARARVHCHYIQLGAPSAMFMPQTSRVERGFGVSLAPIKQRVGFVWRKRVNTHDRVVPRNTSAIKY
jgi:HNH endonuclease